MLEATHTRFSLVAAAFTVAAAALLFVGPPGPPSDVKAGILPIQAAEVGGTLRLTWNPEHPAIAAADSIELRSLDGGMAEFNRVNKAQLAGGTLDYNRSSNDVLLNLALEQNRRQTLRATVRYIGPPPAPAAPVRP